MSQNDLKMNDIDGSITAEVSIGAIRSSSVFLTIYNDFASAEKVWRRFEDYADCYAFQSFNFLDVWYRNIGHRSGVEMQLVVAWGAGAKPLMILPLGIETSKLGRKLAWLGNEVNDYNAPMLAPNFYDCVEKGDFPRLWNDILKSLPAHDFVELMRQPRMVGTQLNPFMELGVQVNASGAHMTQMSEDFDAYYEEKRSSKAKRQFRSRRKQLNEIGETNYVHPTNVEDIHASIDKLVALKSDALKAMGAPDFLAQPGYLDFYRELSSMSLNEGIGHVSHLEVGGEYVAGNWGLVFKGRFYYLLASYDGPGFGRYAPGLQALVELMRWASEKKATLFDFTIGDEGYKAEWCEIHEDLYDHIQARSLRGSVAQAVTKGFLLAKRTIKQNPKLWELFTKYRSKMANNRDFG
ncbi:MAG: GNAT family N-acetyltransferase [Parvibaculum sp.]